VNVRGWPRLGPDVLVDAALLVAFGGTAFIAGRSSAFTRPVTLTLSLVVVVATGWALLTILRARAEDAARAWGPADRRSSGAR
jgi:membrane protein implicated in regulation of membrane protease activity